MPKVKTHKGLKKRVKVTATGKIKRKKSFGGHLMSSKNGKRCRGIGIDATMSPAMTKKTLAALGL